MKPNIQKITQTNCKTGNEIIDFQFKYVNHLIDIHKNEYHDAHSIASIAFADKHT